MVHDLCGRTPGHGPQQPRLTVIQPGSENLAGSGWKNEPGLPRRKNVLPALSHLCCLWRCDPYDAGTRRIVQQRAIMPRDITEKRRSAHTQGRMGGECLKQKKRCPALNPCISA